MPEFVVNFHWIDKPAQLETLCQLLQNQISESDDSALLPLAVDTEFVRTNTYYPIPGLLQIAVSEQGIYLIDPTVFDRHQLQQLGDQVLHPGRQLLMHSAGEDLEIFLRLWGNLPPHLFDTQIAAGFVGFDRQAGLQRLLSETLNIELAKEETRSDWLQRPLTDSQQHYAAEDVRHLFKLANFLKQRLEQQGREQWCEEECTAAVNRYRDKTPDDELYLGFGAGWKLPPQKQAALKHLAQWRESTAREKNIPKTFIAKDAGLYGLVEKEPRHKGQLSDIGIQGSQIRKFGDQLLKQLQLGLQQPVPEELIGRPLSKGQQKRYKQLRQHVQDKAEALNLPQDLLSSKAQLIQYLLSRESNQPQFSPYIGSWREALLQAYLDAKPINSEDNNNN